MLERLHHDSPVFWPAAPALALLYLCLLLLLAALFADAWGVFRARRGREQARARWARIFFRTVVAAGVGTMFLTIVSFVLFVVHKPLSLEEEGLEFDRAYYDRTFELAVPAAALIFVTGGAAVWRRLAARAGAPTTPRDEEAWRLWSGMAIAAGLTTIPAANEIISMTIEVPDSAWLVPHTWKPVLLSTIAFGGLAAFILERRAVAGRTARWVWAAAYLGALALSAAAIDIGFWGEGHLDLGLERWIPWICIGLAGTGAARRLSRADVLPAFLAVAPCLPYAVLAAMDDSAMAMGQGLALLGGALVGQVEARAIRAARHEGNSASEEELLQESRALIRNRAALVFAAVAAAVAICAWSSDDRIYAAMMSAAIFASMRELSRLPEIFRLQRQFRGAHPAA
ncbi:MAG: hypothetical protein ABFD84_14620 [Candidatus Polarisedimenticolia bacterium]|nr:hypothetical protein [bacterium]